MSFKQISSKTFPIDSTENSQQSKKPGACYICGDHAYISNYGVLSCQPCKVFFRRNGLHPENVRTCSNDGLCDVNMTTRRLCAACRLAKCFSMGMESDRIRKEVQRKNKYSSVKNSDNNQKQIMCSSQLPISNLLHNDQSFLTDSELTLLSNIIHAHDTFTNVSQIHRTIKNLSTVPVGVSNVHQIIASIYKSMKSFISSAPDFRILTMNEQHSLLERNLHGVVALYSSLFFRTIGMWNNLTSMKTFEIIYGSEMMFQAERIDKRLEYDLNIIKLILIILAFSSNCFLLNTKAKSHQDSLLNGTFRLFGSQNVYVELLWKYMTCQYGYYNASLRFSRLITLFLDIIKYSGLVYTNNELHHRLLDDIFRQTVESLIIHQNDQTFLWGQT